MTENPVATSNSQTRERESFLRPQAVMPVTQIVTKRRLQIVDGQLAVVVQLAVP